MAKTAQDITLKVSASPDYNEANFKHITVNEEMEPEFIDSPYFIGYVCVRVLNFDGVCKQGQNPIANPASEYFKGRNRRYSIMLQGRFKQEYNGDDILFGVDCDVPIKLPTGWSLGLKVAKWLDPNIVAELDSNTPFLYSPLLCAMNSMAILDSVEDIDELLTNYAASKSSKKTAAKKSTTASMASIQNSIAALSVTSSIEDTEKEPRTDFSIESLGNWKFHSQFVPENTSILFGNIDEKKRPDTSSYEKRKKYFSDPKRRSAVKIDPSYIYCMDFYDAYVDFNTMAIKLPGFSVSVLKYWEGQPLRFAAKTRSGQVLFAVNFGLHEKETTVTTEDLTDESD